jgi:cyclohexyl-isocyanide hydratase
MEMKRREFTQAVGAGAALAALDRSVALAQSSGAAPAEAVVPRPPVVAMLVHPDMVLLDLVGPQTVFSLLMATVHLVGKDLRPVSTDVGLTVTPTTTFAECPEQVDVVFVPGGLKGTIAAMEDRDVLDFVSSRGRRARYVTSVCTGSLVLGAAGLLQGYRATSHWYVRDLLPIMGATEAAERVVVDRNRITGGGVTAGIDFGLTLAGAIRGEDYARRIQLVIEYDPRPPFASGTPEAAGLAVVEDIRRRRAPLLTAARQAAVRVRARLGA